MLGKTDRVYYSQTGNRKRQSTEMSMDSTTNSVDIDGLDSNVEYQFQVVAIAVVNGQTIEGERSEVNDDSILLPHHEEGVVKTDQSRLARSTQQLAEKKRHDRSIIQTDTYCIAIFLCHIIV